MQNRNFSKIKPVVTMKILLSLLTIQLVVGLKTSTSNPVLNSGTTSESSEPDDFETKTTNPQASTSSPDIVILGPDRTSPSTWPWPQYTTTIPPPPPPYQSDFSRVPLFRYYNRQAQLYYFTTQFSGHLYQGPQGNYYSFETSECEVAELPWEGTVPLFHLSNRGSGVQFYTTSLMDVKEKQGQGFDFEGITAYIFPDPRRNTVPFFRYKTKRSNYLYTTNSTIAEKKSGKNVFTFDNIIGYVFPYSTLM